MSVVRHLSTWCAAFLLAACATPAPQAATSWDVVIRGGTIYDGSGGAPYVGDVAIKGDRIAYRRSAHRRPRAGARSTRAASPSRPASSTC